MSKQAFTEWATNKGYDTAHNFDSDRNCWVFFNPMTADLWKAWQAAAGMSAEGGEAKSVPVACVIIHKDAPAEFFIASDAPELPPGQYDLHLAASPKAGESRTQVEQRQEGGE